MKGVTETSYLSSGRKTIHGWIRRKLGTMQNKSFAKPGVSDGNINENKYSPKYIASLLAEKHPASKAIFYFEGRRDFITLSSGGQINVRGGDNELFKAWGFSEFRDLKPQTVFRELEKELRKIAVANAVGKETQSFDSYGAFLNWLGVS